jgi:hypothetical protein
MECQLDSIYREEIREPAHDEGEVTNDDLSENKEEKEKNVKKPIRYFEYISGEVKEHWKFSNSIKN